MLVPMLGDLDTSWQSDAFVHLKNAVQLQRDITSIIKFDVRVHTIEPLDD